MKTVYILIALVVLLVGPLQQAYAKDDPFLMDRKTWIQLSAREKLMYLQGFTRGLAMGAAMPEVTQFHVPGSKVNDIVLYVDRFYGNFLNARISVPFVYMIQSLEVQGSKHEDIDEVVQNFREMTQVETVRWLRSTFDAINKKAAAQRSRTEQDSYDRMLEDLSPLEHH